MSYVGPLGARFSSGETYYTDIVYKIDNIDGNKYFIHDGYVENLDIYLWSIDNKTR